jgi:hypothetical protein
MLVEARLVFCVNVELDGLYFFLFAKQADDDTWLISGNLIQAADRYESNFNPHCEVP